MTDSQMFALAKALAVAKSRQDVPAALEVLHPEMVLQTRDLIASERFFFDLASLCAQSGVSTDVVQRTLLAAVSR
jgi:hypothetical protein